MIKNVYRYLIIGNIETYYYVRERINYYEN